MGRGAFLFAFLVAAASAWAQDVYVPAEASAAKSELRNFLDKNPKASPVRPPGPAEAPYTAFLTDGSFLSVFDGAGNLARRVSVGAAAALPFEGLAIAVIPEDEKTANEVRLLGFAAGKEDELVLGSVKDPLGKPARPRPWLEDVDGDGRLEVCLYENRALRCLRWNAATGKWEWIASLEGKWIERESPPILWKIRGILDSRNRVVHGTLRAKNLTEKILKLAPPPAPVFDGAFPRKGKEKPPLAALPEAAVSFVGDGWTFRVENGDAEIRLPPGGETEVAFETRPVNADIVIGDKLSFDVVGRARWRRFDATYDLPLAMVFDTTPLANVDPGLLSVPDVLSGRVSQEELDRCVAVLAGNRRNIPPEMFEAVSNDVRLNLAKQALLGGGGYTILKESVADATGEAILKSIAETPNAAAANVEQLLWLALMNLDPDEYADALAKAGGHERLPAEALLRLLAYRGNLLDVKALARILALWPEETVAARAKQIADR